MKKNKSTHKRSGRRFGVGTARLIGSAALVMSAMPAAAFEVDTGNPDVKVRWDNTLKYNAGWRAEGRDDKLGDAWIGQATNHGWDTGDMVTNRFDLLTEFDFIYKESHGFRVSAVAWNDFAYSDRVRGNPKLSGMGETAYPGNKFTKHVERWYKGSGELLDAFVFTKLNVGSVPVNLRIGRHNVYWGESLFTFANSIAYGQGPLDLRKATSTPGIEAKELFLPQNQISMGAKLTDNISLAANYYAEWDPHRLPEGGTYLGGADLSFLGGTNYLGYPVVGDLSSGPNRKPGNTGSWGVMTKIKSDLVGGDVGFYYRRFDDRYPTMVGGPSYMYNAYAEDVKLYGVSLSRLVGSVSVGAEISRREGTALASNGTGLAKGNTWHALVNAIAYFGKTPLYHSAPLTMELNYVRLDEVSKSTEGFFNHEKHGCTAGIKAGCATDDAFGLNIAFTPTWFQVVPGVDMTMPINYSRGLKGNSVTPMGPGENAGAWSVGMGLEVINKYIVNLSYNDYFGGYGVTNGVWNGTANGSGVLRDRGWVSLTLKTTF
jgi:hypothetical protein